MCADWFDDFAVFRDWALENGYTEKLSIDRIDNGKGYFPDNCRWVTNKRQANNRRTNHLITVCGVTKTIAEWADEKGVDARLILTRIRRGWSGGKAVMTKVVRNVE